MTRVCLKSNSYGLAFDRFQFYSGLDWTKELLSVFRKYYRCTYIHVSEIYSKIKYFCMAHETKKDQPSMKSIKCFPSNIFLYFCNMHSISSPNPLLTNRKTDSKLFGPRRRICPNPPSILFLIHPYT